ncbi:MAG: hypothetical protein J6P07_09565 [Spirochaetaceae bacterium]|nr:hypothetical protein [Spirochaetaceae bacterium]
MIIDLTLDSLKFPGLENYTPPFGTKKGDNVGLTTAEGCANLAKPWQDQRPIVISENSSTNANIERNAVIEIETASVTLTIDDATFTGCKLMILTTFSSGTATLLHGQKTLTLQSNRKYKLFFDGETWVLEDEAIEKSFNTGWIYCNGRFDQGSGARVLNFPLYRTALYKITNLQVELYNVNSATWNALALTVISRGEFYNLSDIPLASVPYPSSDFLGIRVKFDVSPKF